MIIRRAIADDVPRIAELEELCFTDPWSEKDIFSLVYSDSGMCFAALDDGGELIAYVFGRLIAPEGEIYRVATHPDKRRRGIGYRLLSYALKTERGRGLESTFLEVRSKNIAARALYTVGMRKGYYQNPADDAVIMLLGNLKYI